MMQLFFLWKILYNAKCTGRTQDAPNIRFFFKTFMREELKYFFVYQ